MNVQKYIEIPFKPHGRDFDGCDCYGLVYLIYKNEFNIKLPLLLNDYDNPSEHEKVLGIINKEKALLDTIELKVPEEGCIAMFNIRGFTSHMGVYIGNGQVIHILSGVNSICEKLNSLRLRNRIEGFYAIRK